MRNWVYQQLARNTTLLPAEQSSAILAGNVPPLEGIVVPLLIGAMDCEAMIGCDPKSTWNEKRLARQCLIVALLLAIAVAKE
ncbi:MAG TPA: hypothetical protein VE957_08140 [Terriglobales bacterium]|nr:hypothetical protein [Terriglobales bacterium]